MWRLTSEAADAGLLLLPQDIHSCSCALACVRVAAAANAAPGLPATAAACCTARACRVNKPYLPLASGEWSTSTGAAVVAVCAASALALGLASGSPPLLATLAGSLLLGVLYSTELPLMRWKRSPWVSTQAAAHARAASALQQQ